MRKFELRYIQDDDHRWLVDLHNDPLVLQNITNPSSITFEQHMSWWNSIKDADNQQRLIFTVDSERVGFTKFYNIDKTNKNCILGADIHKDHRGLGYAKHMWSLMIDRCFNELDLYRISLTTADYNVVGQKVYKRLGFIEEGKLTRSLLRNGVYHDQVCMYITKDMWLK